MQTKSTHKGHCQVCGRQQAVQRATNWGTIVEQNATLAKHGYTVKGFGFFMGTCKGSDRLPMEQQRTLTDSTIEALIEYSLKQDELSYKYKTGALIPETCGTGRHENVQVNGRMKYQAIVVPFAEGTSYYREAAIGAEIYLHESEARGARNHIKFLEALLGAVHGQPLIKIAPVVVVVLEVGRKYTVDKQELEIVKLWYSYRHSQTVTAVEIKVAVAGAIGSRRYSAYAFRKLVKGG